MRMQKYRLLFLGISLILEGTNDENIYYAYIRIDFFFVLKRLHSITFTTKLHSSTSEMHKRKKYPSKS